MLDLTLPTTHAILFDAISDMYSRQTYGEVAVECSLVAERKVTAEVEPETGRFPAVAACVCNEFAAFFAAGVNRRSHLENALAGYLVDDSNAVGMTGNSFLVEWSQIILGVVSAVAKHTNVPMIFVGHSLGGACMAFVRYALKFVMPTKETYLVTAGAPRAMRPHKAWQFDADTTYRYMRPGDGVVRLPPRPEELGAAALTVGLPLMQQWGLYAHHPGGTVVYPSGKLLPADLPPGIFNFPISYILGGAISSTSPVAQSHEMLAYSNDLLQWKPTVKPGTMVLPTLFQLPEQNVTVQQSTEVWRLEAQRAGIIP